MKHAWLVGLGLAGVLVFGYAFAQEGPAAGEKKVPAGDAVKEAAALIDKGKAELLAGNAEAAIESLQKAIGIIQDAFRKKLETFVPRSFGDFKGGEIDSQSGSWGSGKEAAQWTTVRCTYRREADRRQVTLTISSSPQLVNGMRQAMKMYDDPRMREMMKMNPDLSLEKVEGGGFAGWLISEKGGATRIVAFGGRVLLEIETSGNDDAAKGAVKACFEAVDRKGLAAAGRR